ncbi:MAG: NAD(P)H-binding protein [Anaerolineae bacterium]|nr:NAD(P)H-binding protein [Anaerolineae bacterium]
MSQILITGGTGVLGSKLVALLKEKHTVRIMSRRPRPAAFDPSVEWAQADLATGAGLAEAVAGIEIVLHAASDPAQHSYETDVEGTQRLIDALRGQPLRHFIYISIVGIDRIPYSYYENKLKTEHLIAASGVPYTILRATQFHELIDRVLEPLTRYLPILLLPLDAQFQLIDSGEVAQAMSSLVDQPPCGLLPDMGGPQIQRLRDLLPAWLQAHHRRRLIIPLHYPGTVFAGFRAGLNTCPTHRQGTITWAQWLARTYPQ